MTMTETHTHSNGDVAAGPMCPGGYDGACMILPSDDLRIITTFVGTQAARCLGVFHGPFKDVPYVAVGSDVAPLIFADLGNGEHVNMAHVVKVVQYRAAVDEGD